MSLFNELKRRNVIRVGIAYVVVAWLLLQVADVILNNIEAPAWLFHATLMFLGLGFILVLVFSWAFEMTPEGIKRERDVDRSQSITPQTGKKLNQLITVVMVLALAYFVIDKFVLSAARDAALVEATTLAVTEQVASEADVPVEPETSSASQSIAVLPFVNMSSDEEQEYFSDGLSEELLNLLAKIPDLKVASRSSAFSYKGKDFKIEDVGRELNVAHVLEGSVRKSGNQVRITAQLIKTADGFHLWSETWDRSLDNIFAIQDEISKAVVDQLKIKLLGEAPKAQVVDPEAYALFLKGRYLHMKYGKVNFENAVEAYRQALVIEPDYAEVWAALSSAYASQVVGGYLARDEGATLAREAVNRALELDPNLATAWARLAMIQKMFDWDWEGTKASVNKALELAPNDMVVLGQAASLALNLGQAEKALQLQLKMLANDPLNLIAQYNLGHALLVMGRLDESAAAFHRLLELNPEDWGTHGMLASIWLMQGDAQKAWDELELEIDPDSQEYGRILVLPALGREAEARQRLDAYILKNQSWAPTYIAGIYVSFGDVDKAFDWLERAYQNRDAAMTTLLQDPLLIKLKDDPRWNELLDRVGLPHQ